eukprot:TRINITY_DN1321_c0_g2_i1.p1 TRINITY_DN1321_c0_g2~~TRINITY_DN1321_c0_g2_i1.p1  ORF type:complete len:748 (-),score=182.93 TRINITY_DN1321_c0_g2_i1:113-2356(-)
MMPRRKSLVFRALAVLAVLATVAAECPNACSGHGTCNTHDECDCYTGYMANDCSQRICPFGNAHVDGGKGDLDGDNVFDGTTKVITSSQMYPAGTVEGIGAVADDAAHLYMECSNKGLCDRSSGTCKCFPAYEGHACQRASCPVVGGKACGGHGVCKTVRELVEDDYSNDYELWDADVGMGCACDAGYSGYDCSQRHCPIGIDPLYADEPEIHPRYPIWNFHFVGTTANFNTGSAGSFRVKFYDTYGEDWVTTAVTFGTVDTDTATALQDALYALSNDVIPANSVTCTLDYTVAHQALFRCSFTENFGPHRVPELIITDDDGHSTIVQSVTTHVYDKGVIGETADQFGQLCDGVTAKLMPATSDFSFTSTVTPVLHDTLTVTVGSATVAIDATETDVNIAAAINGLSTVVSGATVTITGATALTWDIAFTTNKPYVPTVVYTNAAGVQIPVTAVTVAYAALTLEADATLYLTTGSAAETVLLQKCLGDADGNTDNDVDAQLWDYGTGMSDDPTGLALAHPHLIKLIRQDAPADPYTTAVLYWDNTKKVFKVLTSVGPSGATAIAWGTTPFYVGATNGVVTRVFDDVAVWTSAWTYPNPSVPVTATAALYASAVTTSVDASCAADAEDDAPHPHPTIDDDACLSKGDLVVVATHQASGATVTAAATNTAELRRVVRVDGATVYLDRPLHYAASAAYVFKFTPDPQGDYVYNYAVECAGRGLCDATAGLCQCFRGYTGPACDIQSALVV